MMPLPADGAAAPEISIVIPCYDEEENVRAICAAVIAEAEQHAASFELIIIDNASRDRTRDIIRELCAGDPRIRAIFNTRNFGQMRSPTYAIYQAAGRAVIAMGADFQDPPTLIGPLIAQWRAGAQVVLGVRRTERAGVILSAVRRVGYPVLQQIADYPVIPGATGFGLFDRAVVDALAQWHEPEPFFRGMLVESGFRLALIPYDRPERAAGQTKNNAAALLDFAVSSLAGSSKALLRKPITWSFAAMALAGLFLVAAFVSAATDRAAWPWAVLAAQVATFAILFMFIGLLGEQVRVIAERTRNVPLVLEAERINFPPERSRPSARTFVRHVDPTT